MMHDIDLVRPRTAASKQVRACRTQQANLHGLPVMVEIQAGHR